MPGEHKPTLILGSNLAHKHTQYLGSVTVPAQVLREAVKTNVVGLTLRACRAESQAVIVLLYFLHLQTRKNTMVTLEHDM